MKKAKIFKRMVLINALTYLIVYAAYSFANWEMRNPFLWIMQLPSYTMDTRGLILLGLVIWWIALFGMVSSSGPTKKDPEEKYLTWDEIQHLAFIYERLKGHFGENESIDYMRRLEGIIEKVMDKSSL